MSLKVSKMSLMPGFPSQVRFLLDFMMMLMNILLTLVEINLEILAFINYMSHTFLQIKPEVLILSFEIWKLRSFFWTTSD